MQRIREKLREWTAAAAAAGAVFDDTVERQAGRRWLPILAVLGLAAFAAWAGAAGIWAMGARYFFLG